MTLAEAQEHLSRYLMEERLRPLSNEEMRAKEELVTINLFLELNDDWTACVIDWSSAVNREFQRSA